MKSSLYIFYTLSYKFAQAMKQVLFNFCIFFQNFMKRFDGHLAGLWLLGIDW